MEFLNDQPSLVRIVGPFQKALEKLGITHDLPHRRLRAGQAEDGCV